MKHITPLRGPGLSTNPERHPLVLATFLLLAFALCHGWAADIPETWKPFQFLLGDWVGSGSGKPGDGKGEFGFKFDLDERILVRRNRAELSSGLTHQDLMVIYQQPETSAFRADYFDNEGHVIHYGISLAEHQAIFESDGPGAGPKFKLTYQLKPSGQLNIDFAVAAPGKGFQTYVSGTAKRK